MHNLYKAVRDLSLMITVYRLSSKSFYNLWEMMFVGIVNEIKIITSSSRNRDQLSKTTGKMLCFMHEWTLYVPLHCISFWTNGIVPFFFPSSMEHVKFCVNQRGPPRKAKYYWMTDSELVPWGKGEKNPVRGVKRTWNHILTSSRRTIKTFDCVPVEEWAGDL